MARMDFDDNLVQAFRSGVRLSSRADFVHLVFQPSIGLGL
jgi:hypothetical protein